MRYYLAIDIGASSGRHILGHVEDGRMVLEEVHRFDNLQVRRNGHDCWDVDGLREQVLAGLRACAKAGKIPYSLGIDTWAVDFVLLDGQGRLLGDAVAYRDRRTEGMREKVEQSLPFSELYGRTGIQYQPFNTIYQLTALQEEHPDHLEQAEHLLMIPDYLHYCLTGKMVNEYTNATTTALVNAWTKDWDRTLLDRLRLPARIFGSIVMPGAELGGLTESIRAQVGFDCKVILPATHDTGSAFLAVPARDTHAVYLSSGTWSLLGVERREPVISAESQGANLTNEGGYDGRFRCLKNIMGLWMIQSIRRELNGVAYVRGREQRREAERQWSFPQLIDEARAAEDFPSVVDVDDPRFLAPESMIDAVRSVCAETGQPVPRTVGEILQCVYRSLANGYRAAVGELERVTDRRYTSINIVGGGCQDGYLNELTARATGLPVYAGPVEGTALGNVLAQMIAAGEFGDLEEARRAILRSFDIKEVIP